MLFFALYIVIALQNIAIARVNSEIREGNQEKKQKRLWAITLLCNTGKIGNLIAQKWFPILGAPIIFSSTVWY